MTLTEEEAKQFIVDIHKGMADADTNYEEERKSIGDISSKQILKWSLFEL